MVACVESLEELCRVEFVSLYQVVTPRLEYMYTSLRHPVRFRTRYIMTSQVKVDKHCGAGFLLSPTRRLCSAPPNNAQREWERAEIETVLGGPETLRGKLPTRIMIEIQDLQLIDSSKTSFGMGFGRAD